MAYLLFPGRHLLNTSFQESYLWDILRLPVGKLDLVGGGALNPDEKITDIVFCVTSANQFNSRYNPVPFHERSITLDRFAQQYQKALGIKYQILGVPHFNPTEHFAEYTLKEIEEQINHEVELTPQNTIVLCSTPGLLEQYQKLGFAVLTAEYDINSKKYISDTPISVLKEFVELGESWKLNEDFTSKMSKTTKELWESFSDIPRKILALWRDPLLTESGSLTIDRNYSTYAYDMANESLLDIKYHDIQPAIVPGKIVDEGCADAALIVRLARDFGDSDIIGIELTTEFLARCQERLRAGEFGGTYVHFHQRNLLDPVFTENTIDTTICNSTTHELWSYGNREQSLLTYLNHKYKQTKKGGRIVIRDVVGPEDKDQIVYLWANKDDGSNEDIFKICNSKQELKNHLEQHSTHGRFLRFAEEYLADMRSSGRRGDETKIIYKEEVINGKDYIVLKLKDAVEFMTKKDYTDNWNSELNEEFAFWSFSDWKNAMTSAGFHVIENPNEKNGVSRTYQSSWIVENRWVGKVALFKKANNVLVDVPYPPTHMVLVGEK